MEKCTFFDDFFIRALKLAESRENQLFTFFGLLPPYIGVLGLPVYLKRIRLSKVEKRLENGWGVMEIGFRLIFSRFSIDRRRLDFRLIFDRFSIHGWLMHDSWRVDARFMEG